LGRPYRRGSGPASGGGPQDLDVPYLAFSFLVLGVACALNSLWLLGTLVAAVSVMSFVVIPREERYLERRFGAEYLDDKPQLGRWL
jgi:protein-S-isoprenylcysteine O-methyltransferase Ste14